MAEKDKKDKKEDEEKDPKEAKEGEEGTEDAQARLAAKKKKKRKIIIVAALAVLLLGGGGAGVFFSGVLNGPSKTEATGKKVKKKKTAEEHTTGSSVKAVKQNLNDWVPGPVPPHEDDDVVYYNLPEFLVNLNTGGKQTSFIKMKVTLEAASEADNDAIDSRMPRITDSFNTYMRELRTSDIAGSAGLYRLREELLLRVNKTIYPAKVNDVLFREIIIQ